MPQFSLQQPTPYGPVTFRATYDERGKLTELQSSARKLSAVMLKLTYGDRAEAALKYYAALEDNFRFRLRFAPFLTGLPEQYDLIHQAIPEADPTVLSPEEGQQLEFWTNQPRHLETLYFLPASLEAALQRFANGDRHWKQTDSPVRAALYDWGQSLFHLVPSHQRRLVWLLLGKLGTPLAADRMLTELEKPGRHPEEKSMLTALEFAFQPELHADRLLDLGDKFIANERIAKAYVNLLRLVRDQRAVTVAKQILNRQVGTAREAYAVFVANELLHPIQPLYDSFWACGDFWITFDYVQYIEELAAPGEAIDLEQLNTKIAEEQFTDTAPVIWQQQLSDAWKVILDRSSIQEIAEVVNKYILEDRARLKYNALLQLSYVLKERPQYTISEQVLRELPVLVSHRFDKVAALAIAVIRKVLPAIADWPALNTRLMEISYTPGFRMAKLKLLKQLGSNAEVAGMQRAFFHEKLAGELSPEELTLTRSIIKYLKIASI